MIICYLNTADFDDDFIGKLKKAEKKIFITEKILRGGKLSVCGRVLLGYLLKKNYGIDSYSYFYSENGKPFLRNERIHFNISHSGDYVLCCISEGEIGCDIEKIRDYNPKIGRRFFTEKEALLLEERESEDYNFSVLWTLKESILKKEGTGITGGLDTYCFADYAGKNDFEAYGCHFMCRKYGEYMISVCAESCPGEPYEITKDKIEKYIDEINRKNT